MMYSDIHYGQVLIDIKTKNKYFIIGNQDQHKLSIYDQNSKQIFVLDDDNIQYQENIISIEKQQIYLKLKIKNKQLKLKCPKNAQKQLYEYLQTIPTFDLMKDFMSDQKRKIYQEVQNNKVFLNEINLLLRIFFKDYYKKINQSSNIFNSYVQKKDFYKIFEQVLNHTDYKIIQYRVILNLLDLQDKNIYNQKDLIKILFSDIFDIQKKTQIDARQILNQKLQNLYIKQYYFLQYKKDIDHLLNILDQGYRRINIFIKMDQEKLLCQFTKNGQEVQVKEIFKIMNQNIFFKAQTPFFINFNNLQESQKPLVAKYAKEIFECKIIFSQNFSDYKLINLQKTVCIEFEFDIEINRKEKNDISNSAITLDSNQIKEEIKEKNTQFSVKTEPFLQNCYQIDTFFECINKKKTDIFDYQNNDKLVKKLINKIFDHQQKCCVGYIRKNKIEQGLRRNYNLSILLLYIQQKINIQSAEMYLIELDSQQKKSYSIHRFYLESNYTIFYKVNTENQMFINNEQDHYIIEHEEEYQFLLIYIKLDQKNIYTLLHKNQIKIGIGHLKLYDFDSDFLEGYIFLNIKQNQNINQYTYHF